MIRSLLVLGLLALSSPPKSQAQIPLQNIAYADLHNHTFADWAFGGGWHQGNAFMKMEQIYRACGPGESPSWLTKALGSIVRAEVAAFLSYGECLSKEMARPDWSTLNRHQSWADSLRKATETGLKLMVVSFVNNDMLCGLIPESRQKYAGCDDMVAVEKQLEQFKKFDQKYDFIEMATSPSHARKIVDSGRLAAVLSIEVEDIFGKEKLDQALQRYYEKGIRTFQPIHMFTNRFGGPAVYMPILNFAQALRSYRKGTGFNFHESTETNKIQKNILGLSQEGKTLIGKMVDRGFLIDVAHMSEKAVRDVLAVTKARGNYPIYVSHGHFREVMKPPRGTWEKATDLPLAKEIAKSGGIFGVRTSPENTNFVQGNPVANDCQGSTKSFAQQLYWAKKHGIPVAYGSDLNGFIRMTKPRFGGVVDSEGCKTPGAIGTDFDKTGLGQVAQLSDMMMDLRKIKASTESLEQSAYKYIEMWEKAWKARGQTKQSL